MFLLWADDSDERKGKEGHRSTAEPRPVENYCLLFITPRPSQSAGFINDAGDIVRWVVPDIFTVNFCSRSLQIPISD